MDGWMNEIGYYTHTLDRIISIIIINNTNNESLDHWHDDDLFVGLIYEILHTCSVHYSLHKSLPLNQQPTAVESMNGEDDDDNDDDDERPGNKATKY